MGIFGHQGNRIALGTVIILAVPLVAFPGRIGNELGSAQAWSVLLEIAYYAATIYLFNRRAVAPRIGMMAGLCLGYRLAAGVLFGLVVSMLYTMSAVNGIKLGLYGYLPVMIIQVAGTPYVLRSYLERYAVPRPVLRAPRRQPAFSEPPPSTASVSNSREKGIVSESRMFAGRESEPKRSPISPTDTYASNYNDLNAFDRAVKYLGEHGSVFLALVVDNEGLLLANYKRGSLIPEDWAPLALVMYDQNQRSLERSRLGTPEKIDVAFQEKRLVITHEAHFTVLVLAERQADDTLAIRISQCMEMIRKYIAERYSPKQEVNAERIHVSHSR
jgi:predicted regulator of Ras-like GTPase activity (Roadblock/LC7/MglB family)